MKIVQQILDPEGGINPLACSLDSSVVFILLHIRGSSLEGDLALGSTVGGCVAVCRASTILYHLFSWS